MVHVRCVQARAFGDSWRGNWRAVNSRFGGEPRSFADSDERLADSIMSYIRQIEGQLNAGKLRIPPQ
jgi:hypothetical protein